MLIYFKTKKLQKLCSEEREMNKSLGLKMKKKLQQRLMELKAANVLEDLSHLPPTRCHELTNRRGVFSVDLEYPQRLLFIPADEPIPCKDDGGIDLKAVTEIEIIAIEDTHDRKTQRRN
ncbi:killer suppression protein [Marispirochaeta aestuarii]|uniref:Killer suppression protein n=1 Tax=Marispirochaeta aestuarii TaxID=1963862 RepID=A0A1Y1RUB6_9SPIO|nr:killer suppression protein [Marispirochaeta aestuarii]ORC32619.1 killer suppression protein [Marispirochaeta aestuarii]